MEEAAAVRRAARASVDDVEPARLRDDLRSFIDDGSMAPGALALLVARAGTTDDDGLADRAAGVQLIYDGLRLTRRLAHDEPWAGGERAAADMHILAADVLVARGFYLLARTGAATAAVDVVRSFGRDQTGRDDDPSVDANLERDVLELAAIAGTTAAGNDPSTDLLDAVAELATECTDGFPAAADLLTDTARDRLTRTVTSPYADH